MAEWWKWSEEVERHALPNFQPFIKPWSLVFDIGANCGRKTLIFRWLGAKVIAVDPLFAFGEEFVPEFYWKFGNDPYVTVVPKAVAKSPLVKLSVNKFMPYVSSMNRDWMTESAHAPKFDQPYYNPDALITRTVAATTLDVLIEKYGLPLFLKCDVEGNEDETIGTLSKAVPGLNMEFHRDWVPILAIEHMDGLGSYKWNYCLDNTPGFVMESWECRGKLLDHLRSHLTQEGKGSWGDIYGRLD